MYADNEPAMKRNEVVLNDLAGELYTIEADNNNLNCSKSKANKQRRFSKVA